MRAFGRRAGLVLAALLLLWSQVAGAFSYYEPSPRGSVGISRPVITQKLDLDPGERIGAAEMWLDGKRVYPVWDQSGRVSYQPATALSPGEHQVRLVIRVIPADKGSFYAPLESTFSFTVGANAVAELPPPGAEELRALAWVNQYRQQAGLAALAYDQRLAMAALNHGRYLTLNPGQIEVDGHSEAPGSPGYTGQTGGERAGYYAYDGGSAEVINFVDRAEDAIDGWMDTLYHRIPLLHPGMSEFGYGLAGNATRTINVVETGPYGLEPGMIAWPHAGQKGVPPLWDGAETPDPLDLYPGVQAPVGYPITLTFGGSVLSLALTDGSLTGPEGEVRVLTFDPTNDPRLEDTVALIPASPLRPGATYTVRMTGQIDLGDGPKSFTHSWSFQTADEYRPLMKSRVATTSTGGELRSLRIDGLYFGPGLTLYLGGLPVQGLEVLSDTRLTFFPPIGYRGGAADLLLVTPSGHEQTWQRFFSGSEGFKLPDRSAFSSLPLTVRGARLSSPALLHANGTLLLPEEALTQLGATAGRVMAIDRTYWRLGAVEGEYTVGRLAASVGGQPLRLQLPVRAQDGTTYVDAAFAQALGGLESLVSQGEAYLAVPVLGILDIDGHWALPQVQRLLEAEVVTGYGDGTFRPGAPLSRAAFVKMLTAARGLAVRPGETGGLADVAAHWVTAQGYLGAAVAAGIIQPANYPGGAFEPDRPISREEMAVMITRALGLEQSARARKIQVVNGVAVIDGRRFADAAQWSQPGYIAVAVEAGIITGYAEEGGQYTYRPAQPATRAEAAVMVVRMLDRLQR